MEWQPIETAPQDGTRILILCLKTNVTIGFYRKGYWLSSPGYYGLKAPTHWMPLPGAGWAE